MKESVLRVIDKKVEILNRVVIHLNKRIDDLENKIEIITGKRIK